jgi:hypothetical protein
MKAFKNIPRQSHFFARQFWGARSTGLLLCVAIFYVAIQTRRGIWIPEEASFLDYRWSLRAIGMNSSLQNRLSFNEQATFVLPWGIYSWIVYTLGFSVVSHFKILMIIKVSTLLILFEVLFRRFTTRPIAVALSLALFTVPTIRTGVFYAHWWSHIILFVGLMIYLSREQCYTLRAKYFRAFALIGLTVSVWTNIPHLITAWFALPVGCLIGLTNRVTLREMTNRIKSILIGFAIIYAIPFLLYFQHLKWWSQIDPKNVLVFHSLSFFKTVQGFGGWYYFEKQCLTNLCFHYDQANFSSMSIGRQLIRIGLFLIPVIFLAIKTDQIRKKAAVQISLSQGEKVAIVLSVMTIAYLALAFMGHFDLYFRIRNQFPAILGFFRDPYHKFAPGYLVVLYASLASIIGIYYKKYFVRWKPEIFLCVAATFLFLPILNRQDNSGLDQGPIPVGQMSNNEWTQLEKDLKSLNSMNNELCIIDVVNFRDPLTFAMLRRPELFSNLGALRTLLLNDSLKQIGLQVDGASPCLSPTVTQVLVAKSPFTDWPDVETQSTLISGNKLVAKSECLVKETKWFALLNKRCVTDVSFTLGTFKSRGLEYNIGSSYSLFQPADVTWVEEGANPTLVISKRDDATRYLVTIELVPAFGPLAPDQSLLIRSQIDSRLIHLKAGNVVRAQIKIGSNDSLDFSVLNSCVVPSKIDPSSNDQRKLCFGVKQVALEQLDLK